MASDEIVWQVINQQFCAFKLKTPNEQTFCRNEYNVSGLCNRQSCPLANSRYATVRSVDGKLYLYQKTIERAHMPNKLWERILLSTNYPKALAQIDDRLIYWPKFLVHKCKQRLTRLVQVGITARRAAKEEERMLGEQLVAKRAPKIRRREATRERKALAAARLEREIERELVERLKSGAYGDKPLNVDENVWKKVLRAMEKQGQAERDVEYEDEEEEEEELKGELEEELEYENGEDGVGMVEYVSDDGEDDDEDDEDQDGDLEDFQDWLGGRSSDGDDDVSGASSFEEDDSFSDESADESASEGDDGQGEGSREEPKNGVVKGKTPTKTPSKTVVAGNKRNKQPSQRNPKKKLRRGGPEIEVEYEHESAAAQVH